MASPTYQSTTVTDFTVDATSHAANYPATVNAGDLLVGIAAFDPTCTLTTPNGWTLVLTAHSASTAYPNGAVYLRIGIGTEGGTTADFVTSNVQKGSVHILRVTAWQGTLASVITCLGVDGTSGGNNIGLAAGDVAQDWLWIAGHMKANITAWSAGPPSGYSNNNLSGVAEDAADGASIATATKTSTAASEVVADLGWGDVLGTIILIGVLQSGGTP